MNNTNINITLNVPKEIASFLVLDEDQNELQRNAMLLYPYIKQGTISHGRAAEILGITKWEIIELYNKLGFPYIDCDISEVEEEVSNFRKSFK